MNFRALRVHDASITTKTTKIFSDEASSLGHEIIIIIILLRLLLSSLLAAAVVEMRHREGKKNRREKRNVIFEKNLFTSRETEKISSFFTRKVPCKSVRLIKNTCDSLVRTIRSVQAFKCERSAKSGEREEAEEGGLKMEERRSKKKIFQEKFLCDLFWKGVLLNEKMMIA